MQYAEWFNHKLSDKLNIPLNNSYKKSTTDILHFGQQIFENEYCRFYEYINKTDLFNFEKFVPRQSDENIKKIKTLDTKIENEKNKIGKDNTSSKLKSFETQKINTERKSNNLMKTVRIEIFPIEKQSEIINKWLYETEKCYNICVDAYNNNKNFFKKGYKEAKIDIFNKMYGLTDKDCPYDILTDEVRKFCSNLKSCLTNLKNKNIRKFKFKHMDKYKNTQSIMIPKSAVKNESIYRTHLGKIKGLENLPEIMCDCRLIHIRNKNKYWLCVPQIEKRKEIKIKRESVVGIDSGEAIFVAYHGENSFGEIGRYMRNIILKKITKIEMYQKILKRNKNKQKKKIRNKKTIRRKINRQYEKIKNIVKELHNKTALFLCKKYERIMLPKFETQQMVRNRKYTKEYYNKIKEEKGIEEMRKQLREGTKIKKINKKTKKVLNALSHYKFKQHLINKGNEYGCIVDTETCEMYTTKTCTKCGCQEYTLTKRIRKCKNCGEEMDRDNCASRNVIIKNTKEEEIKV